MIKGKKSHSCFSSEEYKPIIRKSICTGESVLGFKHIKSGKFTDVCLMQGDNDIKLFCKEYGINRDDISIEW